MKKNFILGCTLHLFLALKPFLYYECFKVMSMQKFIEVEYSRFLVMLVIGTFFCGIVFCFFSVCSLKYAVFFKNRVFLISILFATGLLFLLDYMYIQSVFAMPPWCGSCEAGHYGESIWERFLCEWRWGWQSIAFFYAFYNAICFTWILGVAYLESKSIIKRGKYLSVICNCLLLGFFIGNVSCWFLWSIAEGFYIALLYFLLLLLGLLWIKKRVHKVGIFVVLCFGVIGAFCYKPLQISFHISRLGTSSYQQSSQSNFVLVCAGEDAVIPLIEAYSQGNYNAVGILHSIGDERAMPIFIDILNDDKHVIMRSMAVSFLNRIGGKLEKKKVADILHNKTTSASSEVRLWAAKELISVDRELAIRTFRKEMNSSDFESELKAATELARLGEKDGISYLIEIIQSEQEYYDWDGFKQIIGILQNITGQKIGWDAKKWKEWWEKNDK